MHSKEQGFIQLDKSKQVSMQKIKHYHGAVASNLTWPKK